MFRSRQCEALHGSGRSGDYGQFVHHGSVSREDRERLYGGQNFLGLFTVFDTPPMFSVRHGWRDVGSLDLSFLRQPCLPEAMELELMVRRVFDVQGATRFLQAQRAVVVQR